MSANSSTSDPMGEFAIDIDNLHFARGEKAILNGVTMQIPRGSIVAMMGPSGVGKTTILKLIAGQLRPDQGSVVVNGRCVSRLSHRELYAYRRKIGVLLQNGALFTDLTVFENVATPVREHTDLPEPLIRRLVLTKLHSVGLRGAAGLMPSELSGGMARRVAFARAVVLDPDLVLYDEPLTGLDPIALSTVIRLMRQTNDALGSTSVVVTHNVDEMALLADYCYILVEGKVAGEGTPAALKHSESEAVRQFMNGLPDGPVPFHYPSRQGLAADLLS